MVEAAPLVPTLKKRSDFLRLRRENRHSGKAATVQGHLRPCSKLNGLYVGYTVSRKTGGSVDRSRIKRRLRHAFAKAVHTKEINMPAIAGSKLCGEVIIIARRAALTLPHDSLVAELAKGIDRLLATGKKTPTVQSAASNDGSRGNNP